MKSYIVTEKGMDLLTGLAAKELRRYLYVLGLELPLIVNKMPDSGNAIIAACKGSRLLESYGPVSYTHLIRSRVKRKNLTFIVHGHERKD